MILSGKNVAYVGGFGGIGFATCKILMLKDIASLTILDVNARPDLLTELKELNSLVKVSYVQLDLCDKSSIVRALKDTVDRVKYLDVLINGSGIVNEVDVELCVGINLIGLMNTTLAAIPLMDKSLSGRGGLIFNIASVLGIDPAPPCAVYSATKHGVVGFTRSLSHDFYFQQTGIMMMLLCPGLTDTPLVQNVKAKSCTLPISEQLKYTIFTTKRQTADECASSLVKAIDAAENGAIWIAEYGDLRQTKMTTYWRPSTD